MEKRCSICGHEEIHVQLTEFRDGRPQSRDLCAACAEKQGIQFPDIPEPSEGESWQHFLHRELKDRAGESPLECPDCSMTFRDFESSGQLSCPGCYQTFMGDLTRLLASYHGDSQHRGRFPRFLKKEIRHRQRLRSVRERLQESIASENYEEAARLRDEVKDLEIELQRIREEE